MSKVSILGSYVLVAVLCTIGASQLDMSGLSLHTALWVCVGYMTLTKLAIVMYFMQGYGVKKDANIVLGMPMFLIVCIAVISILLVNLLSLAYEPSHIQPQTIGNIKTFCWAAWSGVVVAIGYWYVSARKTCFLQSEDNIRLECLQRGESPEATEQLVASFRRRRLIQ